MKEESRVTIHYHRPPNDTRTYVQRVVAERDDVVVTLSEPMDLSSPLLREESIMLERGSLVVWFTFPGAWHDIGRFHRADGSFSGVYANVLTPPRMNGSIWHTTDLFLDLWWPRGGPVVLLDEDELDAAILQSHIDREIAARARAEAQRLLDLASRGSWPPPVVEEWTLERSLRTLELSRP